MNVVRHYHPSDEIVFLGVVKQYAVLRQLRDAFALRKQEPEPLSR
jgi:hypothetical protein